MNENLSRQEKLESFRRKEAKESRRKKVTLAVVLLSVVALIGVGIWSAIRSMPEPVQAGNKVPTKVTSEGAFRIGTTGVVNPKTDSKAPRVEMFFDPMCPGCAGVDQAAGERMQEAAKNGEVDLYMNPLSFLDRQSTDRFSSRAASAFITIAENSPAHAVDFLHLVYSEDNHPSEGAAYRSVPDSKFVELAKEAGVDDATANLIPQRLYQNWVLQNTEKQNARTEIFPKGITTPTMVAGGKLENGKLVGFKAVDLQNGPLEAFNNAIKNN